MMERKNKIKYQDTWKGQVIKAITVNGAKNWEEIRDQTNLNAESLNLALKELYDLKLLSKNDNQEYKIEYELYKQYRIYYSDKSTDSAGDKKGLTESHGTSLEKILSWMKSWEQASMLEIDISKSHFYLQGQYLDSFSKGILNLATLDIIVVTPFVSEVDLTKLLIPASKRNVTVKLIRRPAKGISDMEFHDVLSSNKIEIIERKKVHSKIIVVDRCIAVVSSMNFNKASSAGESWEAGLVTIDPQMVEEIIASIDNYLENSAIKV